MSRARSQERRQSRSSKVVVARWTEVSSVDIFSIRCWIICCRIEASIYASRRSPDHASKCSQQRAARRAQTDTSCAAQYGANRSRFLESRSPIPDVHLRHICAESVRSTIGRRHGTISDSTSMYEGATLSTPASQTPWRGFRAQRYRLNPARVKIGRKLLTGFEESVGSVIKLRMILRVLLALNQRRGGKYEAYHRSRMRERGAFGHRCFPRPSVRSRPGGDGTRKKPVVGHIPVVIYGADKAANMMQPDQQSE